LLLLSLFVFLVLILFLCLGMAHIKETAKLIEDVEANTKVENIAQHSEGEEDLSQMNADPSELMGREKSELTL
jgi:hypothetical protein